MSNAKGVCAPSSDPMEMLISRVVEHEGIKKFAYTDTLGYTTVGIGRCIDARVGKGLSVDECFYLLRNDLAECRSQLTKYDWFKNQDEVRQGALIELCFNLGITGLIGFKNMITSLKLKSYAEAVKHLKDSKWASQVGARRVEDICWRLGNGRYK